MKSIAKRVETRINELISEFEQSPDKFLTEEDVRAYLYHLLLKDFGTIQKAKDDSYSIPLHTEVRWYGTSGKLRLRADIVIFDVATLRTKNTARYKLPSKAYQFDRPQALIEIKLRRNRKGSDTKFRNMILRDRTKIGTIKSETEPGYQFQSYILALDKKGDLDFQPENTADHKEFYVSLKRLQNAIRND